MTTTWDSGFETSPVDSDQRKYGAGKIRELKTAISERLELEHDFKATGRHRPGLVSVLLVDTLANIQATAVPTNRGLAFATDTGRMYYYDSGTTSWIPIDANPVGTILPYGGATAPAGYLLCDGASLLRAGTYAPLYGVIGVAYGSIDGTHFSLPDGRGKVLIGASAGHVRGATGGEDTHTLDETEMAVHTHGVVDPGHTHAFPSGASIPTYSAGSAQFFNYGGGFITDPIYSTASNGTGITLANEGSGVAHNNMQPYVAVGGHIIKY